MTVHVLHPQQACFPACLHDFVTELKLEVAPPKSRNKTFKKPSLILKPKRKRKQKLTVFVERKRRNMKRSVELLVNKEQMKEALLAKAVSLEKSVLKQSGPVILYKNFLSSSFQGCPLCGQQVQGLKEKIKRDIDSLKNIMKNGDACKEKRLLSEQLESNLIPAHLQKSDIILEHQETLEVEQEKIVNTGIRDALLMIKKVLLKSNHCALCESPVKTNIERVIKVIDRRMAKLSSK